MRARRDPFARHTLQPFRDYTMHSCDWCGGYRQTPTGRPYTWGVRVEHDGGRADTAKGRFDSWDCFDAYHGR